MTPQQNKIIHSLLNQLGLMPQKANLVLSFTNQRTESSKEMHPIEALEFIKWLTNETKNEAEKANQMRRKILAKAHRIKWEFPNGKVDVKRVNDWCITKSYLKKPFNQYTFKELPQLVSQFEIVYQYYLNNV